MNALFWSAQGARTFQAIRRLMSFVVDQPDLREAVSLPDCPRWDGSHEGRRHVNMATAMATANVFRPQVNQQHTMREARLPSPRSHLVWTSGVCSSPSGTTCGWLSSLSSESSLRPGFACGSPIGHSIFFQSGSLYNGRELALALSPKATRSYWYYVGRQRRAERAPACHLQ